MVQLLSSINTHFFYPFCIVIRFLFLSSLPRAHRHRVTFIAYSWMIRGKGKPGADRRRERKKYIYLFISHIESKILFLSLFKTRKSSVTASFLRQTDRAKKNNDEFFLFSTRHTRNHARIVNSIEKSVHAKSANRSVR